MLKLDRGVTNEYFMLDFAGQRFTHYPSGDTCLRHEWMDYSRRDKWIEKVTEFFERHPSVSVIVNDRYEIVDDADSYPYRAGDYKVGDVVMARVCTDVNRDDWGMCARTVIERIDTPKDAYVDGGTVFKLDDGGEFWWDENNNGWFISAGTSPDEQRRRIRPPLEGEETLTLDEKKQAAVLYGF
jgi:hypothetical protein